MFFVSDFLESAYRAVSTSQIPHSRNQMISKLCLIHQTKCKKMKEKRVQETVLSHTEINF